MAESMRIFDRAAVRRQRARAAPAFAAHDFLVREVAERLAERLEAVNRRFAVALDLGCHTGQLAACLKGRGGIETLIHADLAEAMVARAPAPRLVCDEEVLPLAPASLDLVIGVLGLHWVNDLPGTLIQIARALRPDGLFMGAMLGGETLRELKESLVAAELEGEGGAGGRTSPVAGVADLGALLQRAGLALPVVDSDTITVTYADPLALMRELRAMGEGNAVQARRRGFSRRGTLLRAGALYRERFADGQGRVPATFEVLTMTGWAPHETQQKPLRPGSATRRLADGLGATEIPAGEKAAPLPPAGGKRRG